MTLEEIKKSVKKQPNQWVEYRKLLTEYLAEQGVDVQEFWSLEYAIKQALGLVKNKGDEA